MTVKDGKADRQKNVPISETYHHELQAISLIEKKPMKEIVEGYIRKDGRGKMFLERANAGEEPVCGAPIDGTSSVSPQ